MESPPLRRQPDFGMISNGFGAIATEFSLFPNLPAVDRGVALQETLQAVLEQLRLLNRKVDGVDRRLVETERRSDIR